MARTVDDIEQELCEWDMLWDPGQPEITTLRKNVAKRLYLMEVKIEALERVGMIERAVERLRADVVTDQVAVKGGGIRYRWKHPKMYRGDWSREYTSRSAMMSGMTLKLKSHVLNSGMKLKAVE